MRLLFTSLGSFGHTFPLVPLAIAARDAGHDVVFATSEDFLPQLTKAGLETAAAGLAIKDAFGQAFAESGPPGPRRPPGEIPPEVLGPIVAKVFGEFMPKRFAADLLPLFEHVRPDLVVSEVGNSGGALAALKAGIPVVAHGFGRVSSEDPMVTRIRDAIREHAATLGIEVGEDLAFTGPFVDICPESVQEPGFLARAHRVPLRPVGWSEPGELPAGVLDKRRPLVYLTLGTAMGHAGVLGAAITGLSGLDVDVLVATGPTVDPAVLGEVPENVRLEAWVPQSELLPHVDLVVHHGGSGTTLGAFGAGLPQLLLPQGADQFSNADAVVAAGVGSRLLGPEVTAEAVASQARHLLTDTSVRDATRALAAEVAAMPSPADVAAQLPTLA
ncbi:glycosyltransferase [Amycolatopsis sp. SID8362]|uniref:glycosyltransferase n=1 Tax=Amycolatopsis sp. SID8362 TaxID=2690346 RepID=UPI00136C0C3B|nr:glycosyltransferase [Amycolatopsis sp. SID8362]NBH03858.1 glycosyltransferase [Amycolatopsis sp. SID8362]NED40558.1 glycosyltransferase family 1 protein [Amycolatopsis sp. SID8362]